MVKANNKIPILHKVFPQFLSYIELYHVLIRCSPNLTWKYCSNFPSKIWGNDSK